MKRVEKKYFIKDKSIFFKILQENRFIEKFPEREILSIYYDNKSFQSFQDAEEGTRPRLKIRLRKYINSSEFIIPKNIKLLKNYSFNLEKKTNFKNNIKTKKDIKFEEKYFKFFDDFYGWVYPVSITLYKRKYFDLSGNRLTFDYKIRYYKVFQNFNIYFNKECNYNIGEFKAPYLSLSSISNKFPFLNVRYSKYLSSF